MMSREPECRLSWISPASLGEYQDSKPAMQLTTTVTFEAFFHFIQQYENNLNGWGRELNTLTESVRHVVLVVITLHSLVSY
jgi:hypothetical protein